MNKPSSASLEMAATGLTVQACEERFHFLTQPRARMAYGQFASDSRGLHFGQVRQIGVVCHMLSALGSSGRPGLIVVGDSPAEACAVFGRAETALDKKRNC